MTRVRQAEPADLPALRRIQTAALADPWPGLLEPAVDGAATALVAAADGLVVGYAVAFGAPGEPAYVPELAVAADHRRQGHGTALIERLCQRLQATGHPEIRLAVRVGDEGALSFYDARGFRRLERLPEEYASGDGVLLERSLDTDA